MATHPSQYLAPLLRHVSRHCPEVAVTALYASVPNAAQHGREFTTDVDWGVPLLGGYRSVVMRESRPGDVFSCDSLRGIDVAGVTQALRDTEPDVVLVPGWHSMFLLRAIAAARRLRVPAMYRGDSHLESSGIGVRQMLAHTRARALLKAFASGLAVGQRARAYLTTLGMPDERVFDVRHCVDNAFFAAGVAAARRRGRGTLQRAFGLPADGFIVLFAGKLAAHKRVGDLIAAAAQLDGQVTLHIVGSGPEEAHYRDVAARAGTRAVFSGFLNQHDLLRAYAAADCLALPSRETWGMVCNEALASGLPLVVSDAVGSAPDLVERNVTGQTFKYGKVDDLATALGRALQQHRDGAWDAEACRARAAQYSFDVAAAGLARACRATLASLGRTHPPRLVATMQKSVFVAGNEKSHFELFEAVIEHQGTVHCLVNRWDSGRIRSGIEHVGATWSYSRHWYPIRRRFKNPLQWVRMAWEVMKCSGELWRVCRRRRATHVLFPDHVSLLLHALAIPLLRLRRVQLVLRVANATEVGRFYEVLWRRFVIPAADLLVANSTFTSRCLIEYGAPDSKVRWTYQPVPTVGFARSERDLSKVVYVGQLLPDKGIGVLMDAVESLLSRGVDVRLDVVGDTDGWLPPDLAAFRAGLIARAQRPPLNDRVRFLGWCNDVTGVLAAAAVHCAPSLPAIREAMGRVVIEAKATATPSVVFASGALPEIVHHGIDGIVCREATAEALSDALEFYLHQPARVDQHGRAARADTDRFSRSRWVKVWAAILGLGVNQCEPNHAARS